MIQQTKENNSDAVHAIEKLPRKNFRTTVDTAALFEDKSRRL